MCCNETDFAAARYHTLLIGYGNTLRADDGAGPAVIKKLSAVLPAYCVEFVRLIACGQLTPELALDIAEVRRVIFVDASMALSPGQLTVRPIHREESNILTGHHFTPGMLLNMTQRAFGACPIAWVAAIGCQSTDIGDKLTPQIAAAVDRLVSHLRNGICQWINGNNFLPEVLTDVVPAAIMHKQAGKDYL